MPVMNRIKRVTPGLITVIISLSLALLVAELVLRVFHPLREYCVWPPNLRHVFRPIPGVMPGVAGIKTFSINEMGLRGDPVDRGAQYRILAVGGSTTECLYLDDAEAWPWRLQKILNSENYGAKAGKRFWVGNAGKSGVRTRHHIVAVEYLLSQQRGIDAVLVMTGANDFGARMSMDSLYRPLPFDAAERQAAVRQMFALWPHASQGQPWFRNTEIWGRLHHARQGFARRNQKGRAIQDDIGSIYRVWRKHRASATMVQDSLPDLGPAILAYEKDLEELLAVTVRHHAELVLATQPSLWSKDLSPSLQNLLWWGGTGDFQNQPDRPYYSVAALQRGLERYNDTLRRFCQAKGLACIDLSACLPKDTTVFYDDMHFNTAGSNLVAEILAPRLWEIADP